LVCLVTWQWTTSLCFCPTARTSSYQNRWISMRYLQSWPVSSAYHPTRTTFTVILYLTLCLRVGQMSPGGSGWCLLTMMRIRLSSTNINTDMGIICLTVNTFLHVDGDVQQQSHTWAYLGWCFQGLFCLSIEKNGVSTLILFWFWISTSGIYYSDMLCCGVVMGVVGSYEFVSLVSWITLCET